MRYLSVCSGIEAASVAWHHMGWEPVAFSEIEQFPAAVLKHHYPNVPNLGDMTNFKEWPNAAIDVLVGGTPCQSFSVAGLRKGLDDPRGNLMLTFGSIAKRYRPQWLVWENVPGVLSSNGGRDFGAFLGMLEQLGYGWSYRTLDAQYFGVAQRRRRVFVVGCLGDWRRAAAVLFERHSLQGHPPPRRQARERVAPTISARPTGGGGLGTDFDLDGGSIAFGGNNTAGPIDVATACNAKGGTGRGDFESETFIAHTLRGEGFDASEYGSGRGTPLVPVSVALRGRDGGATAEIGDDLAFSLRASSGGGDKAHVMAHAFDARQSDVIQCGDKTGPLDTDGHSVAVAFESRFARNGRGAPSEVVPPLKARSGETGKGDAAPLVAFAQNQRDEVRTVPVAGALSAEPGAKQQTYLMQSSLQIRRLTPRECERLQGFPDDYTQIPYRNKPAGQCPDGPRHKALGNSMAVPVMRWIGERIAMVEELNA